jgi:hypothetical protein
MKSIVRFDYGRTRGWSARVQWMKRTYSKLFSDGVWGGKRPALQAAITWRNQQERVLGKPRTETTVQGREEGTPGVYKGAIRERPVWVASWPGGKTSFSIARHGDQGARKLALEARERRMAEFYAGGGR